MSDPYSVVPSTGSSPNPFSNNRSRQALLGGTNPSRHTCPKDTAKFSHLGVIPIGKGTFILLSVLFSLIFIFTISCAFMGAGTEEPYLKKMLNNLAESDPGIVLFGESVDIDIDEPSITIRWSILACGEEFVLPNSTGVHRSDLCGLPVSPLQIFVDSGESPIATYDPSRIPFDRNTGGRRSVQNLVQFDSDHVLDVHEARIYPFDTYTLTSTIRVTTFSNESISIRKLATIYETSNFDVSTTDVDSYVALANGTYTPSRDIDMHIRRPPSARLFSLGLFALGWMLTHVAIGNFWFAKARQDTRATGKHLLSAFAILSTLPQLRNSMPDAPGLDGVLIDCIGFFAQMIVTGLSVIALLALLIVREFDLTSPGLPTTQADREPAPPAYTLKSKISAPPMLPSISESISSIFTRPRTSLFSPTRTRPQLKPLLLSSVRSSSVEPSPRDFVTFIRDMNDEYAFPPRTPVQHRTKPSEGVD